MKQNTLRARLACLAASLTLISACGGGGGDSPGSRPAPVGGGANPSKTYIASDAEAVRFLSRASFGGTKAEVDFLSGRDATDWVTAEFAKSPTFTLPKLLNRRDASGDISGSTVTYQYWDQMLTANDQLRQRMAFALSQILVYSDIGDQGDQEQRAYYQDILIRNAFGNYRTLLEEVTYSPAMADFLTYYRNRKGDPNTGRMPDENYAREVMQLFTIGLVELNMDGTPKPGEPETYTNDDVVGLSRVFTGLSGKGTEFWDADNDYKYHPLQMYDDQHSQLEKSFLGTTIPENTPGTESIDQALDTLFAHPNVAPFVSRQLIQRFTSSSPDPAYVARVATAFETGSFTADNGRRFGTGERGDLQATLAAVLLDESLYDTTGDDATEVSKGKIREPVLRFAHMVRAFNTQDILSANESRLRDTMSPDNRLAQHPMRSPSVFNFYRPGYIAPNTRSGELGMTAPELQIVNQSSAVGYNSFMTEFAFDRSPQRDSALQSFEPNYTDEIALVGSPDQLVDHLALLLTADRMPASEREEITSILTTLPISSDPDRAANDRFQIVATAISLVVNSPSFAVVW